MPYALCNHTGCTMLFATLTTTPTRSEECTYYSYNIQLHLRVCKQTRRFCCLHRVALSHSSSADSISDVHGPGTDDTHNISQWREVLPGEEIPFEFEAREKLRHR